MTYIIQSSRDSSSESNRPSTKHTIIVSVVDSRGGMDVFDIKIQDITSDQFSVLLRLLYALRENLRTITQGYVSLITDTISIINVLMAENEGNNVYAIESSNFTRGETDVMEDMIASCNKQTLDINLAYWLPDHTEECPSLGPFIEHINQRRLFSVDIYARNLPNWNTMLTELQLLS